jgi:CO/xanthine dehydrogenase Mo-binding subunit
MNSSLALNRREFLKVFAVTGSGLILGVCLPGCRRAPEEVLDSTDLPKPTSIPDLGQEPEPTATGDPNAVFDPYLTLRVAGTGIVTVTVPRPEMGQGVRTSLTMIVAEELDADWAAVRVEQAPADSRFGNQTVGGSRSIMESYTPLRKMGATARAMLVSAAAQLWGVSEDECTTEAGVVHHSPSGERLPYAQLVEIAATLPVPRQAGTKAPADFKIIGTPMGRIDNPEIVTGRAVYGSDLQVPGMLYAAVARCPVFGGRAADFDPAPALAVPGVRQVVPVSAGVAVVADDTWSALQGRAALNVVWDEGNKEDLSSESIREQLMGRFSISEDEAGLDRDNTLRAFYEVPFLAHATQEPMNCTADVRADGCEVWAPTQVPGEAKGQVVRVARLPADAVTVHIPLLGGGFGRRLQVDYVQEAVEISQAVGAPVKLQWTRDDDMQHDFYHPFSCHLAEADLNRVALPRVRTEQSYAIPTGAWRSVDNHPAAFVRESFLDEMAAALGQDPLEMRLALVDGRLAGVLRLVAEKAGWGSPLPEGRGRGVAAWSTFGVTHVAHVAEVSVDSDGKVRVHRVVCAVDCGVVINPGMVTEQMEGGIVFGLTAALKAHITIDGGRAGQSNFHDYPLLRMEEMPDVEVHIRPSEGPPTGVGEMGVPPIAPAVANAVYAATGKRVRRLPILKEALVSAR